MHLVRDKLVTGLRMVNHLFLTWHVANVTNLITSTESLTGCEH